MLRKIATFWRAPLYEKIQYCSTLYFRTKAIVVYRWVFKNFGSRSYIRKPILIRHPNFITIGEGVGIRDGVRLEVVKSKAGRIPDLSIGDNTNIEQNVHIVCHNRVRIGSNVSITANCAIVDVTHPFEDIQSPDKIGIRIKDEDSFVEIGDGTFLGVGTIILPNVKIGNYAIIGANSVVTTDIPDFSVAAGSPARVIRKYDFAASQWRKTPHLIATEFTTHEL